MLEKFLCTEYYSYI